MKGVKVLRGIGRFFISKIFIMRILPLLIVLGFFAFWILRPPTYSFDFKTVSDPDDIENLYKIAQRLEGLDNWQPNFVRYDEVLNKIIESRSDDSSCNDWEALLMCSGEHDIRMANLNEAVLKLALNNDASEFKKIKGLSESKRKKWLIEQFEAIKEIERYEVFKKLVNDRSFKRLVKKYNIEELEKSKYRGRWSKSFIEAVHRDMDQVLRYYGRMQSVESFYVKADSNYFFRPKDPNQDENWVNYNRLNSSVKLECWLKESLKDARVNGGTEKGDISPKVYRNTGVLISGAHPLSEQSGNPKLLDRMPIQWPPKNLYINKSQFSDFLHSVGLPTGFVIGLVSPSKSWRDGKDFTIEVELGHQQLENFKTKIKLEFALTSVMKESIRRQIKDKKTDLLNQVSEHLLSLNEFDGFACHVTTSDEAGRFDCEIEYATSKKINMALFLSGSGSLQIEDRLKVAQRYELADYMCVRYPEIKNLSGRGYVKNVNIIGSPAKVVGTVIFNEKIDPVKISYSMSNDGHLLLSKVKLLRDISKELPEIEVVSEIENEGASLNDKVKSIIKVDYPKIAQHVEIAQITKVGEKVHVSLGLHIYDLPPLRVGPESFSMRDGDKALKSVIAKLLSEQIVTEASNQRELASKEGKGVKIESSITKWDPDNGKARIHKVVKHYSINTALLNWDEDVFVSDGQWVCQSEDLCKLLEPVISDFENSIQSVIQSTLGLPMRLRIDRNRYGEGQWLQLHPFEMAFDCSIKIEFIDSEIHLGQLIVDRSGLHRPNNITLSYRTSLQIPPYMTVSDPEISYDFKKQEIGIGVKFSPPGIPGISEMMTGYTEGIPKDFLRIDNLWLHVAYVHAKMSAGFNNKELTLSAALKMLNSQRIASGKGTFNWNEMSLILSAQSCDVQNELAPSISGRLAVGKKSAFEINGSFDCFGHYIEAGMKCDTSDKNGPAKLSIIGGANVPVVGDIQVSGWSYFDFKKYKMIAEGSASGLNFAIPSVNYRLTVDEKDYNFEYWFTYNKKVYSLSNSSAGMSADENKKVEELFRKVVLEAKGDSGFHSPSSKEKRILARYAPDQAPKKKTIEIDQPQPSSISKDIPCIPHRGSWVASIENGRFIAKAVNTEEIRLDLSLDEIFKSVKVSKADIDDIFKKRFILIPQKNESDVLFIVDNVNENVWWVSSKNRNSIKSIEPVSYGIDSLNPFYLNSRQGISEQYQAYFHQNALAQIDYIRVDSWNTENPIMVKGGVFSKFHKSNQRLKLYQWYVKDGKLLSRYFLFDGSEDDLLNEKLCEQIGKWSAPSRVMSLLARKHSNTKSSNPKIAILGTGQDGKGRFYTDAMNDENQKSTVDWCGDIDNKENNALQSDLLQALVHFVWTKNIDISKSSVICGVDGIILVNQTSMDMNVLSTARCADGNATFMKITKEQIQNWNSRSVKYLPSKYLSKKNRAQINIKDFATEVVLPWERLPRDGWKANPIGLLESLSTK